MLNDILRDDDGDTGELVGLLDRAVTLAEQVRDRVAEVHQAEGAARVGALVAAWNWATCPSRAMTDAEHGLCCALGRWCWQQLQVTRGWRETQSGRLRVA